VLGKSPFKKKINDADARASVCQGEKGRATTQRGRTRAPLRGGGEKSIKRAGKGIRRKMDGAGDLKPDAGWRELVITQKRKKNKKW